MRAWVCIVLLSLGISAGASKSINADFLVLPRNNNIKICLDVNHVVETSKYLRNKGYLGKGTAGIPHLFFEKDPINLIDILRQTLCGLPGNPPEDRPTVSPFGNRAQQHRPGFTSSSQPGEQVRPPSTSGTQDDQRQYNNPRQRTEQGPQFREKGYSPESYKRPQDSRSNPTASTRSLDDEKPTQQSKQRVPSSIPCNRPYQNDKQSLPPKPEPLFRQPPQQRQQNSPQYPSRGGWPKSPVTQHQRQNSPEDSPVLGKPSEHQGRYPQAQESSRPTSQPQLIQDPEDRSGPPSYTELVPRRSKQQPQTKSGSPDPSLNKGPVKFPEYIPAQEPRQLPTRSSVNRQGTPQNKNRRLQQIDPHQSTTDPRKPQEGSTGRAPSEHQGRYPQEQRDTPSCHHTRPQESSRPVGQTQPQSNQGPEDQYNSQTHPEPSDPRLNRGPTHFPSQNNPTKQPQHVPTKNRPHINTQGSPQNQNRPLPQNDPRQSTLTGPSQSFQPEDTRSSPSQDSLKQEPPRSPPFELRPSTIFVNDATNGNPRLTSPPQKRPIPSSESNCQNPNPTAPPVLELIGPINHQPGYYYHGSRHKNAVWKCYLVRV